MNTLTLQVENPSILAHLKAVLSALKGVKVLSTDSLTAADGDSDAVPNDVTRMAMEEAKSGNDAGVVGIDSIDSFVASME